MRKCFFLLWLVFLSNCAIAWAAEGGSDWNPSPEEKAAAKQLAVDLGVVLKEDHAGNVILIDTAAKRSWANDY